MDEIIPNLYIGDLLDANEVSCKYGDEWAIISVTDARPDKTVVPKSFHKRITRMFNNELDANPSALDIIAVRIDASLKEGKKVLIHCSAGIERSPLTVVWYLYKKRGMSINQAYELVQQKRPMVQDRSYWLSRA
jgi:protein-tyrosine phosphatase